MADHFNCKICVRLLNDPVTIPCGHSYCFDCIKGYWRRYEHSNVYPCLQCAETFTPMPALNRNCILAELLNMKTAGLEAVPPAKSNARHGPRDVLCDVCVGRKLKAVKSCLVCIASYCETHLKLHDELNPGKRHKLTNAFGNLQEKICPHHDKMLEVYCRTDMRCICYLCTMDEHRGHDTVSASAERSEKQKLLRPTKKNTEQKIQEKEKELQDLRQAVQSLKLSAQAAVEESERIFTELIRSIERRRSEVKELIRDQEKAEVSRAEGLLERLEQEIAELRGRDAELEELLLTEDHIHFLQTYRPLCVPPKSGDLPSDTFTPQVSFEAIRKSTTELRAQLEHVCGGKLISSYRKAVTKPPVPPPRTREPRTREDFLQYSCRPTMDPNTTHRTLQLTERDRKVTCVGNNLPFRDHSERFNHWFQGLSREGLSGRCYWEAEWSNYRVSIAMACKEISRKGKGNDCALGGNAQSWSLFCSTSSYSFWHNNKSIEIPVPSSSRIGVYLDHRAGTLSFYSVSDTMTLLHRVQTTFTQPLYPAFGLYCYGSTVKLCDLE
ncbi:hypothetical protein GJAV_G00086010 [Gymnothorax javanicus]|nr:hypothetical protein GJAV_G00086010 [Gymnothorax javanicus]